jgi:adenylate kinase
MALNMFRRAASTTTRSLLDFRVLLLGAPGSGKGTYGGLFQQHFDCTTLSTGDLVRAELAREPSSSADLATAERDIKMRELYNQGAILPDEMVLPLVAQHITNAGGPTTSSAATTNRLLFDGFPRTVTQAKQLDQLLLSGEPRGSVFDYVVNFYLPDDVLIDKLASRWGCPTCGASYNTAHIVDPTRGLNLPSISPKMPGHCDSCENTALTQRADDTVEVATARLQAYHATAAPLLAYYQRQPVPFLQIDASDGLPNVWPRLRKHTEESFPDLSL